VCVAAALMLGLLPVLLPAREPELGTGRFLVASRGMADPRFAHTVVLIVEHGSAGAVGLVVNRATGTKLGGALPGVESGSRAHDPLMYGGPVAPGRAAVLVAASAMPQPSRMVFEGLHFSTEPAVLESLLAARDGRFRVYAGYAGWGPGQLEGELARGDWIVAAASLEQVFSDDGMGLWRQLVGARGTWVRRDSRRWPPSVVLARDLHRGEAAVGLHLHADQHGLAAHAAVLDVPGAARGAVDGELDARPAERAGG